MAKQLLIVLFLVLFVITVEAKFYTFFYPKVDLKIGVHAENYPDAFKKASKECFNYLTGGKYQGEEKSLDIIDICANPKEI